jgi:tRNA threonylcarbamoyladenosine biosynthesis protein TsaE
MRLLLYNPGMPILKPNAVEVISRSPEQTRRVGMRLGGRLQQGDVVCLVGDLGSGKTTFVQGINAGWGSADPVTSPTFVLVNVYRRADGARLYHLDSYRLRGASEAEDLDLDTILESGPVVVEWADRILAALPADYLLVRMKLIEETQRDLVITANGERGTQLLAELRKEIYGG